MMTLCPLNIGTVRRKPGGCHCPQQCHLLTAGTDAEALMIYSTASIVPEMRAFYVLVIHIAVLAEADFLMTAGAALSADIFPPLHGSSNAASLQWHSSSTAGLTFMTERAM